RLTSQLEEHQQSELVLASEIQKKEAKIEDWRNRLYALDESIDELQNVLLHTTEELEKIEGRKEVLKERKKNASQNKQQLERSVSEYTNKIELLKAEKDEQTLTTGLLETETNVFQTSLDEKLAQIKLFSENIEQKIETLKSDYIE